ncbi:MAG TPA: hypothetical protein VHR45_01740 [Thermoanaerobaculia bacterium]|nr:hypothetical protein [Thermoanaerobaculia bacterium]
MPRVGLATCAQWPQLPADDCLLLAALRRRGAGATAVVWDDPAVCWADFHCVVIRSCWDHHHRPAEFLAWLLTLEEAGVAVWNPPSLVRSHLHKGYLRDLEAAGFPIMPTVWLQRGSHAGLARLLEDRSWGQAVIKPAISASAFRTRLVSSRTAAAEQPAFDNLLAGSDVMVQRFAPEIRSRGEWSLIFIAGAFSHAILKRPAPGDFRVQQALGGSVSRGTPSASLLAAARAIAAAIPEPWLYARVDGLEIDGIFTLMELELIEPVLFLAHEPRAAARCAEAVLAFHLELDSSHATRRIHPLG